MAGDLHRELSIPALYVSHSRSEVIRLADQVVLLEGGRVRAVGPVEEVSTLPGVTFGRPVETGAIAEAEVAEHDVEFGLTYLEFGGGRLSLPADVELRPGTTVRVQVLARDVSLTLRRPEQTSILNVLAGRIAENLKNVLDGQPIVEEVVDPDLIGGVVVRVGDTVFDGSVATQLESVRQRMIERSAHEIQTRRDRFRYPAGD